MGGKLHFPVVAAGIIGSFDDHETVQPGVEASPQIGGDRFVTVRPARSKAEHRSAASFS